MAADDARAALEAIAFGDDPSITPGDRLRALQQLAELPGDDVPLHVACQCPECVLRREVEALGEEGTEAWRLELGRPAIDWADPYVQQRVEDRARQLATEWRQAAAPAGLRPGDQRPQVAPDAPAVGDGPPRRQLRRAAQALRRGQAKHSRVLPAEDGTVPLQPPAGIDLEAGWPVRDERRGAAWRFRRHG